MSLGNGKKVYLLSRKLHLTLVLVLHLDLRFHLDTETVREIESLDAHDQVPSLETISTKIPIYEFPTRRSPNLEGSKIPSRLPKPSSGSKYKSEAFPDMSDIFLARTEELLHSSRSKSGKKRRHTTIVEPRFETSPPAEAVPTAATLKRHPPLKRTESPTNLDLFHGPRSFNLNEVDAGIGSRSVEAGKPQKFLFSLRFLVLATC